jgi:hypothetical protein
MAKGQGFSEKRAYAEAEKRGGVAVPARKRPGGGWTVAGWSGDVWIVLSEDRKKVLADG